MKRLGKAIALLRMVDNTDQARAAKIIGISKSMLSRIETGKGGDAGSLAKILTWLFEDDAEQAPEESARATDSGATEVDQIPRVPRGVAS